MVSFNLPGLKSPLGSAGKLLPQIEVRTLDVETESTLPRHESGILCFRGPNIFSGYLDSPDETRKVLDKDGWLRTGDLGRVDDHGYLFVEGRLSRISKIGGEMVPHAKIEDEVKEALGYGPDTPMGVVILGQPDEKKGEQIVFVVDQKIDFPELKKEAGRRVYFNFAEYRTLITKSISPLLIILLFRSSKLIFKTPLKLPK